MKVVIAFPPLKDAAMDRGRPKKRAQATKADIKAYPLVAASAATLLKAKGYDVVWLDAAAEGWSYRRFFSFIKREQPDILAIQTTTAQVKRHWRVIDDVKRAVAGTGYVTTVLTGDHVTALPEESFHHSTVDFILTGGNYDFLLLNICSQLSFDDREPGLGLEPGIWYRHRDEIRNTGRFRVNHDLNRLPMIDRELTKWWLYDEGRPQSPTTYSLVARDCGWGKSPFSSDAVLYPDNRFRARTPDSLLNEIGVLISKYGISEIIDQSSAFPTGSWLRSFCQGMISRGYNKKVRLGCNIRLGSLTVEDWQMMREAGFRKIFFGIESANSRTLKMLGQSSQNQKIFENVRCAKRAGLEPHISVLLGLPWETPGEINNTVEFARRFLVDGWAEGLESRFATPYPGTKFFSECKEQGWLRSVDWDLYDESRILLKNSVRDEEFYQLADNLTRRPLAPRFYLRRLLSLQWFSHLVEKADQSRLYRRLKELLGSEKDSSDDDDPVNGRPRARNTRI